MSTTLDWNLYAGKAMTAVGSRFGINALIYHRGVMRMYDGFAHRNAPGFAERLVSVLGEGRYLDVGAGTGRYGEALRRLGAGADACEHSKQGRKIASERGLTVFPFNLAHTPPGPDPSTYDVALCLEVAEHLPAELGDRLVTYLADAPTVVFTAAPPGQGGTGHINEQPKTYWETRFEARGKTRARELESAFLDTDGAIPDGYLLANLMIFR